MILTLGLRQGYRILREGDLDGALAHFLVLSRKYPNSPEPEFELGKIYFKKGNLKEAQAHLMRAAANKPKAELVQGILELTNWWMISSSRFFNATPVFSPDGRKVLYTSARQDTNGDGKIDASDRAGIYVFDLDNGHESEIIPNTHHHSSPTWSPDGRYLLYTRAVEGPAGTHAFQGQGRQLLLFDLETGSQRLLDANVQHPRYPSFTPDGNSIVLCNIEGDGHSVVSTIDLKTLRRRALTSGEWEHTYPQASRDGKWLLYVSWRRPLKPGRPVTLDDNPGVFLMNRRSESETMVVSDDYSNAFPSFSPHGNAIVYLSRRTHRGPDGKYDWRHHFGIYTLDLATRRERCVSPDSYYNKFPAWSHDGKWIVFLARWPHRPKNTMLAGEDYFEYKGIYRVSAAGGKVSPVVSDKFFGSRYCAVSTRNSLVAYVSWRPKTNRGLFIADYLKPPSPEQLRSFIQNNLA